MAVAFGVACSLFTSSRKLYLFDVPGSVPTVLDAGREADPLMDGTVRVGFCPLGRPCRCCPSWPAFGWL
jgi:hypothetical protein